MNRWVDFLNLESNTLLFVFFVLANVVSIFVFGTILLLNLSTKNYETKNRYFNALLIFEIAYFIVDILWAFGYFGIIPASSGGLMIAKYAKMTYFIIGGFAAFSWFMYIEILMGARFSRTMKRRLMLGIPILISTVFILIIFIVTEYEKFMNNPLVAISMFYIPAVYTIFAGVYSIVMAVKGTTIHLKKKYITLGIFPVMLITVTTLQIFLLEIPVFCLGTTLTVFLVFILNTQSQVSTDALTGINNRSALTKYIGEYTEFNCTYVLMIDVDRFKSINDNFGHVEGDRALVILAKALKKGTDTCACKSFLARYGGDEFIIIASDTKEFDVEELVRALDKAVSDTKSQTKGYQISVSIGYSRVIDNESILTVIENADEKMYKAKALKKQNEANRDR